MHPMIMRAVHSGTTVARAPRSLDELRASLEREHASLPEAHWDLLKVSDGLTAYGGYFRILGAGELMEWNAPEAWKFAWPPGLESYFCFAETAWGDQYAYRRADMGGTGELPVYFLESILLTPEKLADTFVAFLEDEFIRNSHSPYDDLVVDARQKLGDLDGSSHVVSVPSPLIAGAHSADNAMVMPARAAMIANGDLATQLGDQLQSRTVRAIEPYEDTRGRPRLRVLW